MKIKMKMIGNAILIGAAALALSPREAVAVAPSGKTTTSLVQVSKEVNEAAFVNRLIQTFKAMAASDSMETRSAGIQYLEAIQRPGIYGLIEQISIPALPDVNSFSVADTPPQSGSIRVSQWCGQSNGYTYVFQVTEKYMGTSPSSQSHNWVQTKSVQRMVTTCPSDLA